MQSTSPAWAILDHQISDAHMVDTPTPPLALHNLALSMMLVGFGIYLVFWPKIAAELLPHFRFVFLGLRKSKGRLCRGRYLADLD